MPTENFGLSPLARRILAQRGINSEEAIEAFVNPESYIPVMPEDLPGLSCAVELLLDAVNQGDRICVYGDYDTDGVTSTVVLVSLLRLLKAQVEYHVPDRFREGYGINEAVLQELAANGVKLILTCDCGIANLREVQLAGKLGLKVIVTDHHVPPSQLPPATAIVNPQFFSEGHQARFLPGVGVAYMLALAVLSRREFKVQTLNMLDLVALGMVADVVPLRDENRYLLQLGLQHLNRTSRLGLKALVEVAGLKLGTISEEEIAFQLVPRINAAGRLVSASLAVELLLTEDETTARQLAAELDNINRQRRKIGETILQEAVSMLENTYAPRPIVLYRANWHHGVIGIIAGRLAELYKVPVLLMSLKEDGSTITGSARSINGIHIFEVLQKCDSYLLKYGGHAGAAGFSLEVPSLELFSQSVEYELTQAMNNNVAREDAVYDLTLDLTQATIATYRQLHSLAPFGAGNPVPKFRTKAVEIRSQRAISDQKHLRLVVSEGQVTKPAVWWWGGGQEVPPKADIIYSLSLNSWQGQENIQLVISNIRECEDAVHEAREHLPRLEVVDLRHWQELGQNLPPMPNARFFFEGKQQLVGLPVHNRYSLGPAPELVLLSIPPGLRLLQEVVALCGAGRLILAYGERDAALGQDFLVQVIGLAKYSLANRDGKANIAALAVATGQSELTVVMGLRCLQARGFVKIAQQTAQVISLEPGSGKAEPDSAETEAKLKTMLTEARAFRHYMLKATPHEVMKLLEQSSSTNKGEIRYGY